MNHIKYGFNILNFVLVNNQNYARYTVMVQHAIIVHCLI